MVINRFSKVLVANRGEIAIRVCRAATELGLRTVAIYSEEDKFSLHRYKADEAYRIGEGLGPVRAYLAIDKIIELALKKQVEAIHPGYGFLSENPDFASACEKAGIVFIGPNSKLVAMMGDKVAGRKAAEALDIPIIPGTPHAVDLKGAVAFAKSSGFPLIIKAAFGGGGRGMRTVRSMAELKTRFGEAERESKAAFGRAEIFVERLIERPKHIEVQILGDHYGNVVHLFERDCSIQRRHQKVIEMAPAVSLLQSAEGRLIRDKICDDAARLTRHIGYTNAGTVEFLYEPESGRYYFIEMNTRIQVEHTVTELITGYDLVKSQIRIAQGYALSDERIGISGQQDIQPRGVAIQCRITTEDPAADFLPDYGRITVYRSSAGHGIRLDAGTAHTGAVISPYYDSLLVKVSAHGRDLVETARRMDRALAEFRVRGVKTNIAFLQAVMQNSEFLAGDFRTDFLEKNPKLLRTSRSQDRASKLLEYIADVSINGNPVMSGKPRPTTFSWPQPPAYAPDSPVPPGSKQILDERGAKGLIEWIHSRKNLLITDTTFRDAHQSALATRMRSYDLLATAGGMARQLPSVFSCEMWGGATFDTSLRFLKEDPWVRLRDVRRAMPNILLQMLLRGANAVGYTNYPDNVIKAFVKHSADAGIDIFRIFDSLNWIEGMRTAIDAARDTGRIAEASICYTGNIEDPKRSKFSLKFYVSLAKQLEKAGAQILAIKDMAGLLRPFSARILVKALKDEVSLPIHLHTHDTSGIQGATLLTAAEAGVNIVDAAVASMSGLTSQPNLNSIVAALEFHKRATGLDLHTLNAYSDYWEDVRKNYDAFESDLRSGTAKVYEHEMPGGQYTNLRAQADALNLGDRWTQVVEAYQAANRLFGDIVKVTPSSKVVGDMALFMVANNITEQNFFEKAETLSFPASVIGMMRGELGQAPGGFPPKVQKAILKGHKPLKGRPGKSLKAVNFKHVLDELRDKPAAKYSRTEISDDDVMSHVMYPQVTVDYLAHRKTFGDTSVLPTPVFFYGMKAGEEVTFNLEEGKTLFIKLVAVSEPNEEGRRICFFELNGMPRDVSVEDRSVQADKPRRQKANPEQMHQVGATSPGLVVQCHVKPGDAVRKGDALFVLEAMKMETCITAPLAGVVKDVLVGTGETVEVGDLILTYK